MSEEGHSHWRTPALDGFGEQLERLERSAAARRGASRRSGRGWTPRVLVGAGVLAAALAAALILVLATRHAPPAQADPTGAARAALQAGSFTFQTTGVLSLAGGGTETVTESGAVDLKAHAYQLRVGSQGGRPGFERVLFPGAIYVRATKPGRQFAWTGVGLRPAAVIAPTAGASTGIADPLGLLEVLSRSHGSVRVGRQLVGGVSTTHYRLRSTIASFLAAQGQRSSAHVGASNVTVDVWIDRSNRVLLARRLFVLGGSHHGQLVVQTRFAGYGVPVAIRPPAQVGLHGHQPPSQAAEDPLNSAFSSVLGAPLLHSVTASVRHK